MEELNMKFNKDDIVHFFHEQTKKIITGRVTGVKSFGGIMLYSISKDGISYIVRENQLYKNKDIIYKKIKKRLEMTITKKRKELDDAVFSLKQLETAYIEFDD